jgi:hypothetical protein
MATRILPFTATIPAGTLTSAPVSVPMNLDTWDIEQFDLEVPSGPSGLMGFQIYNNGVGWLPYGANQWIIWDNVQKSYALTDQPNAGGWAIVGYNLDLYPHTVTVRAHVSSALGANTGTPTPPTITILSQPITADPVTL